MKTEKLGYSTIDEYIATCPKETQPALKELRDTIKAAAPQASEKISYRMPTFFLEGNLVHFALMKNHIGFYPTPSGVNAFLKSAPHYESTKGAIHLPLGKPLPLKLVAQVVKLRVAENTKRAKERSKKT